MKTIVALPLLALVVAACQPYPQASGYPGSPQPYPQDSQGYPPYPPGPAYPGPNSPPYPPGPAYPGPNSPAYPSGPSYPAPGYPQPGYPTTQATYRAVGNEPFWDLEVGQNLTFTDRGNNVSVVQQTPQPINGTAGEIYRTQRLEVNITHTRCGDGMSDRSYPDTVNVYVDGRQYRGCGAPIAFFSQGEGAQPSPPPPAGTTYPGPSGPAYPGSSGPNYPGPPIPALSGTNWQVVSINGTPTPAANFYLNFMPDRISAKFGCNSLGAGYVQNGSVVNAGAVMATRMACPDMSFENQGSAVLAKPMSISGFGNHLTLSNSAGSIDLVRAN